VADITRVGILPRPYPCGTSRPVGARCVTKRLLVELAMELFTMYTRLAFGVTMIVAAVCVLFGQVGVL